MRTRTRKPLQNDEAEYALMGGKLTRVSCAFCQTLCEDGLSEPTNSCPGCSAWLDRIRREWTERLVGTRWTKTQIEEKAINELHRKLAEERLQ